ncbi:MAG: hypothetical protein WA829_06260, partial [Candidatus Acidiferrum sp.]
MMGNEFKSDGSDNKSCDRQAGQDALETANDALTGRRLFLQSAVASAAALALPRWAHAGPIAAPDEMDTIRAEI